MAPKIVGLKDIKKLLIQNRYFKRGYRKLTVG